MNDQTPEDEIQKPPTHTMPLNQGHATFDVTEEAAKALKRYEEEQARRPQGVRLPPAPPQPIEGDLQLRIEIQGASTPLLLTITEKDTVIGRRDPTTQLSPELDLTPYGGYQMGISRRHAIIHLKDKHLEVVDLDSRNGTYLNGQRLKAHQADIVSDGAEIRLGKIVMHLHFQD